jgi:hypothetical protein
MTRRSDRNEDRYQRAMERLKPSDREYAKALALKECGFVNYEALMFADREKVDRLTAHKLGERFAA